MFIVSRIYIQTTDILIGITCLLVDILLIEHPVITIKHLNDARKLIIGHAGQKITSCGIELTIDEFRLVEVIIRWSSRTESRNGRNIFCILILIRSETRRIIRHIRCIGICNLSLLHIYFYDPKTAM